MAWEQPTGAFDWAHRFDAAAREQLHDAPGDVLKLGEHPDFRLAVPTPDHFIPLVYLAALASVGDTRPEVLVDGYTYASISMACYVVGCDCPADGGDSEAGALPDPQLVPPEQANI